MTATTPKERPILFSGEMVRAILDGRKTQTRRVVKPQPIYDGYTPEHRNADWYYPGVIDRNGEMQPADEQAYGVWTWDGEMAWKSPYGAPGDRLWVRETWAHVPVTAYRASTGVHQTADPTDPDMAAVYRAGWDRSKPGRWRPSIHMPRWASRILLEVVSVRVERLQEISDSDAMAEGIERVGGNFSVCPWRNYRIGEPGEMSMHCSAPSRSFMTLWESINAKRGYGWESNPWVWVVEFKQIKSE